MSSANTTVARDSSFFAEIAGSVPVVAERQPERAPVCSPPDRTVPRLEVERDAALRAGFAQDGLLFALGTKLVPSGEKAYQESRVSFDAMPLASKALAEHVEVIKAEKRTDRTANLADVRMLEDGRVIRDGGGMPIVPTEDAFVQLVHRADIPRGAGYLVNCPTSLRSFNVNYWLERRASEERQRAERATATKAKTPEAKTVVMRCRKVNDAWQAYACVSPGYTAFDSDEIAVATRKAVEQSGHGEARASIVYDGRRTRITTLFHADADADVRVGSNYKAGVQISSGDTGMDSLNVKAVLWQAVCVNLTTVARSVDVLNASHRSKTLAEQLGQAVSKALGMISPFMDAWREAEQARIVGSVSGGDVEPAIVNLVRAGLVPNPGGCTDEELIRKIRGAYWKAPSPTVGGIVNAVTRAAHESTWRSPWVQDELQDSAGFMVWNQAKVLDLAGIGMQAAHAQGWKPSAWTLDDVQAGTVDVQPVFAFQTR